MLTLGFVLRTFAYVVERSCAKYEVCTESHSVDPVRMFRQGPYQFTLRFTSGISSCKWRGMGMLTSAPLQILTLRSLLPVYMTPSPPHLTTLTLPPWPVKTKSNFLVEVLYVRTVPSLDAEASL